MEGFGLCTIEGCGLLTKVDLGWVRRLGLIVWSSGSGCELLVIRASCQHLHGLRGVLVACLWCKVACHFVEIPIDHVLLPINALSPLGLILGFQPAIS